MQIVVTAATVSNPDFPTGCAAAPDTQFGLDQSSTAFSATNVRFYAINMLHSICMLLQIQRDHPTNSKAPTDRL